MATENLAAAGSSQGLMQSRSGEYINQDMARQKFAEDKRQDDLNREDKYKQQKLQKAKDEESEIAKFIDFNKPVMPKDEQERVAEASSIVKMIKDGASKKDIDVAKVNFIANDERRKAEYIRAANDLSLANSKPDEYEIVNNPFSVTSKAEYKSKFGSDRYDTSHFIKPNSNIDVTGWITKKTPDFLKQTPQGLNQSKTEVGTSFADEDTRMKWQTSTINQMLDGITPQSRALLKETTNEVLSNDSELQYYPEELDAVVKQVAANKILKVWDSQKRETKIDNNAPTGGKGLEINNNLGNGGVETPDGVFIPKENPSLSEDAFKKQMEDRKTEAEEKWIENHKKKYPKTTKTTAELKAMHEAELKKPSKNNPELTIEQWNEQQARKEADNKGLTAISFTPKGKDNWFEATTKDGKIRKIIPKTIYKNDKGELVKVEGYNVDESTGDIKIDLEEFEIDTKNEDNRNSFIGKYPTTIKSVGLNVPTKVVVSGKQNVGTIQGKGASIPKAKTQDEFNKAWANLKKGESIVAPNGQTYKKK